jgi:hypothetical protein
MGKSCSPAWLCFYRFTDFIFDIKGEIGKKKPANSEKRRTIHGTKGYPLE